MICPHFCRQKFCRHRNYPKSAPTPLTPTLVISDVSIKRKQRINSYCETFPKRFAGHSVLATPMKRNKTNKTTTSVYPPVLKQVTIVCRSTRPFRQCWIKHFAAEAKVMWSAFNRSSRSGHLKYQSKRETCMHHTICSLHCTSYYLFETNSSLQQ